MISPSSAQTQAHLPEGGFAKVFNIDSSGFSRNVSRQLLGPKIIIFQYLQCPKVGSSLTAVPNTAGFNLLCFSTSLAYFSQLPLGPSTHEHKETLWIISIRHFISRYKVIWAFCIFQVCDINSLRLFDVRQIKKLAKSPLALYFVDISSCKQMSLGIYVILHNEIWKSISHKRFDLVLLTVEELDASGLRLGYNLWQCLVSGQPIFWRFRCFDLRYISVSNLLMYPKEL